MSAPESTRAAATAAEGAGPILQLEKVTKRYGGVVALDTVDFACRSGSIHAVLGENGAGKSTLIKIISGVVEPDAGRLLLGDAEVRFPSPLSAMASGIACVFQELSLIPDLSVADNICIVRAPGRLGFIAQAAQRRRAAELLDRIGCGDIDPRRLVRDLPLSRRQVVEIAKALNANPRLLILDEATSALTGADVERVYRLLHSLRNEGLALLYISHRMHEIDELADTCSVFRNGRHVETFPKGSRSDGEIVQLMIGRDIAQIFPERPAAAPRPEPLLQAGDLRWQGRLNGISLSVGRGEIVGLGGLDGQGQRELLLALFGVLKDVSGEVRIEGAARTIGSPKAAIATGPGIALIPEDRKTEGLMLPMSIRHNIGMASLGKLATAGVLDPVREARAIDEMTRVLQIKLGGLDDPVSTLSGGNQQKVVIAKWLMTGARIILLNDPTRGIDIGTKQEIYGLMRRLADAGSAILFFSTDYAELVGCCDRVLILYGGTIRAELEGDAITEQAIVSASLNLSLAAGPTAH